MRKSHTVFLLSLIVASICAGAFAADAQTAAPAGVVNINTADASQIAYLPRIGAKAAQRVVDYRAQNGPFRKATDLMQVKGFGDKTFERVSPYITIEGKTTLTAKVHGPRKPRAPKSARKSMPSNTASK
ncbi:MAG TPA: helix-hairpin-helix domain-containing protein [Thermoanaerobaculia bacterium]|nr:helix-hairpin-helix domain-containing protein [Thermoanaerobaculia bacterium]